MSTDDISGLDGIKQNIPILFQPMSFGGKNMKMGREKEGNIKKKGERRKKNEQMKNKKRK
jgi:hypothetical protein